MWRSPLAIVLEVLLVIFVVWLILHLVAVI